MDLISTEWLEAHLEDPNLRIMDIRGKTLTAVHPRETMLSHYEDYTEDHIPNAVFVDWIKDITDDSQHKRVAPPNAYADTMGKLGVTNDHHIVAYDDASNALASRLWWTLKYYGHDQVSVLDGGWQKWLAQDGTTTSEVTSVTQTDFTAKPHDVLKREGHDIVQRLGSTTHIVDMRLPDEYRGEMSLAQYSGHIPGAVNLPVRSLVNEDNSLLEPEQLGKKFAEVGIDESASEVIFYSNVGVLSCLGMLAMRVAGLTNEAANYDASWQEWGNDPDKPKVA